MNEWMSHGWIIMNEWMNESWMNYKQESTWFFATNSDSVQPNVVDLRYFKLWILLDKLFQIWKYRISLDCKDIRIRKFEFGKDSIL